MSTVQPSRLPEILARHETQILDEWIRQQREARGGRAPDREPTEQSREFLQALRSAVQSGRLDQTTGSDWAGVRDVLTDMSQARARQGLTSTETATFVFSLKQPLFSAIRRELGRDPDAFAEETWRASTLLDSLGLFTTEVF